MQYVSTRGGPPVSGIEAVCRGISRTGGLYVPESPPEPLSLSTLQGMPFQEVMAAFYHRFLPDLPLGSWEAVVRDAFRSLEDKDQVPGLPLTRLNDYLDRYFLINADHMPTGSLADLTYAVFSKLWPLLPKMEHTRLVMALLPEDSLVSLAGREADLLKILFLPTGGARGGELAARALSREQVRQFEGGFDALYRECARLAAEPSFEEKLGGRGFAPLFIGPGHLLEVLTAGALATAVAAAISGFFDEERMLDFAVAKDHLSFVAGLVYASILGIPLGTVYVGESEPASLMPLFRTGKSAYRAKRKRPGHVGTDFPVNLERLIYEVTGRDGDKTGYLCEQAANPGEQLLSEDEIHLLNQSIVVGSCDYKYCLRLIRTVYDQTDFLVGRDTADAIACWAKHADQKAETAVCYVQERSPLLDATVCARALFGKDAGRMDAIRMVSEETDVPLWPSLAEISQDSQEADWPVLTGSIEEAVYQLLDSQDAGR